MEIYSSMNNLDDLDFRKWMDWKLKMELVLGLMDLDFALREKKPCEQKPGNPACTGSSTMSVYEKWERSNRLSLLMMRNKIHDGIYALVPEIDRCEAKRFLAALEELFLKVEESKDNDNLGEICSMIDCESEESLSNQIIRLSSFLHMLRTTGSTYPENIVSLVVDSLHGEKSKNLKMNYVVSEKKWGLVELICKCETFEAAYRSMRKDSNRDGSGNSESEWMGNDDEVEEERPRPNRKRNYQCFNCGQVGHIRRECKQIFNR